ncbi:hypothetical protein JYP46_01780 [Nitratireductor aquimarinus]|uniref:hypothetical protein n=1 Tax=Alphaproteobacteria TaxID=28211 RepID=UPI0019D35226|nr:MULTISPECIES: hypothetical protein [Alphaproteobacteria]MBN7755541.1 hypothetical protein [Nitratireductor aquimarinus]MBY5998295.1 hypothetical protein [Tritonibacter mobilis]MBY6020326.1 hypothetical protein [Nitratireductor sp. DP7N14-4]
MATDVERLIVRLEATQAKFEKQMAKANQVANRRAMQIEGRFQKMNKKIASYGRGAFNPLIASATAALAPIALVNKAMATVADAAKIGKVADKVGLATDELQQLRYVAELAGVQASQMDVAMQRFSRRVAEAANGSGELLKVLEANGVTLREADGTMRSQRDILRDYADLIKNAGSEQEQLLLAFKAFDTEGAALVNLFRDGSEAIDTMAQKTEEAGGVIDEELIRRAEKIDDEFSKTARNFETNFKEALLNLTVAFEDFIAGPVDALAAKLGEIGNAGIWKRLADFAGVSDAVFVPGEGVVKPGTGEMSPSARVAQAFQGEMVKADVELLEALKARYGQATSAAAGDGKKPPKTIIPGSGSSGGRGSKGSSREDSFQREIAQIRERTASIQAMTAAQATVNPLIDDYGFALERATAIAELENAAKKAGLEITPQLSEQIRQLATAYATATVESEKLAESQDNARQQADDLKDLGKDVLGGFINDLRNGVDAAEALEGALQKVADKLLDMALNNLIAGLFGGGFGGGGLLSLFGFAKGGIAAHGKPQPLPRFAKGGVARSASIFGEAGPEAAVPLPDGRRIPVDLRGPSASGSRGTSISMPITIDARDANAPALARVNEQLKEMQRSLPKQIDNRINTRDVRGTRP